MKWDTVIKNTYTIDEIVTIYKNAKHKTEQIKILADLTGTDKETIIEILSDAGAYEPVYTNCTICGAKYPVLERKGTYHGICPWCTEERYVAPQLYRRQYRLNQLTKQREILEEGNQKLEKVKQSIADIEEEIKVLSEKKEYLESQRRKHLE